jgi:hypothetical protein
VQDQPIADVLDPVELHRRRAADHAMDLITALEQEVGEMASVVALMPVIRAQGRS